MDPIDEAVERIAYTKSLFGGGNARMELLDEEKRKSLRDELLGQYIRGMQRAAEMAERAVKEAVLEEAAKLGRVGRAKTLPFYPDDLADDERKDGGGRGE